MLTRSRMKRTATKPRRASGPDPLTVELVVLRDRGRCVPCGMQLFGDRGEYWCLHHRRGRDGKPDSHSAQNLIAVCGASNVAACHGRIHQQRAEAEANGWWLSRVAGTDPLTVAVYVASQHRRVFLTADGRYAPEAS